jgi:hypothetical protein
MALDRRRGAVEIMRSEHHVATPASAARDRSRIRNAEAVTDTTGSNHHGVFDADP